MKTGIGIAIGIPFGNQDSDSYSFTLTSTGDGSGVSMIKLVVTVDQTIELNGTARFYSDAAGTLNESTTWLCTVGSVRTRYLRCPSGVSRLKIPDQSKVSQWNTWTSSTNAASLGGTISNLTSATVLDIRGSNTLSGSVAGLTSLTYVRIYGSNILSDSVAALTSLTYLYVTGLNRLSGDINAIVNGITTLILTTCHMDTYTAGATWSNATVKINPAAGYGYSSTEIDNMLIDMDNSGVFSGKTITLQGSSAARTSASDAAVTSLQAAGNTIVTNP